MTFNWVCRQRLIRKTFTENKNTLHINYRGTMQETLSEFEVRTMKVQKIKDLGVIPYAQKFDKKNHIDQIIKDFSGKELRDINDVILAPEAQVKTAGRLTLSRSHGKLSFAKILDQTWEIQLMFHRDNCKIETTDWTTPTLKDKAGEEMSAYKFMEKMVDMWDFIGVTWEVFLTHKWELTIFVSEFKFLSKAIRPLPEKFHGLNDQEELYRKRYLDMITDDSTFKRFMFRSEFIKTLRDFYDENWFIEIETPVLGSAASWAAAKPFITHHNDFDQDFFLRISPETNLKKATVWRLERVFEIWRQFRNEWSDPSHLQEFTSLEHYAVYRSYKENIEFTEKMFDYIFDTLNLDRTVMVKDKEWVEKEVNFTTPWERIDYVQWVQRESWIDILSYWMEDADKLRADIKAKWIQFEWMEKMWLTTLIDYLYKKVLRPKIIWPAFVYNYPKTMQPLARVSDENNNMVEQFQLVVNWWEILKAYSELVDPLLQKANFAEQAKASAEWDQEATSGDDDFVTAMEYGMPCQSWRWMWLERILAILTQKDNLRDVVMFPLMKPTTD